MKRELLQIIACPKCIQKFEVTEIITKNNEVYKGRLICKGCKKEYPVENYIPRLVENFNYSQSWGILWKETGEILRDSFTGTPWHYNVIHGKYDESCSGFDGSSPFGFEWPKNMKDEIVLEIGPGTGNCTEHLVKTGATIIAVDMSDAVDTLPEELLVKQNLNVIQADITQSIIPENYFDRIWLFQVLQHTPSPPETLKRLNRLVKGGGKIALTSYMGKYNPWYYRLTKRINDKFAWKIISFYCPILVPLKYSLMKIFTMLRLKSMARFISKVLDPIDPRNIYFNTLEGNYNDYIFGIMWEKNRSKKLLIKYVIMNTFDRITPDFTNSVPNHETMAKWLKDAGFKSIKTWGRTGSRASAIK